MNSLDEVVSATAAKLRSHGYEVAVGTHNQSLLIDGKELCDPGEKVSWLQFVKGGSMPVAYCGSVIVYGKKKPGAEPWEPVEGSASVAVYGEKDIARAVELIECRLKWGATT